LYSGDRGVLPVYVCNAEPSGIFTSGNCFVI